MAITITRTAWVDDDGSGTTGTVINNAVKTELYGQIDTALALAAAKAEANTFTALQTFGAGLTVSAGLLTVNSFGTHTFSASAAGTNAILLANPSAGTDRMAQYRAASDTVTGYFGSTSSTFTTDVYRTQAASFWLGDGAGGIDIKAINAAGTIKFSAGGTTEAGRFHNAVGRPLMLGITAAISAIDHRLALKTENGGYGAVIKNTTLSASAQAITFLNSTGGGMGNITLGADNTTTTYNTTSDKRLKSDLGLATDVSALRKVEIRDFLWKGSNTRARGVFAQDAHALYPTAITKGLNDDLGADGFPLHPWGADYSKFVPDLIVGWQQHEAAIKASEARIAALGG